MLNTGQTFSINKLQTHIYQPLQTNQMNLKKNVQYEQAVVKRDDVNTEEGGERLGGHVCVTV